MPVAIILGFDAESTHIINQVFKKLKENKFTSYYQFVMPHITLTSYETIDLQVITERLTQLGNSFAPFTIQFSSFGYFPSEESVLFLSPKADIDLFDIRQKVLEVFEDFQAGNPFKSWVPHCSLALEVPLMKIGKAIAIVKEDIIMMKGAPFCVEAQSICTVEFTTDPLIIISTNEFNLKKTE